MARKKPWRKYNGEIYHHYMITETKREALPEAKRLRHTKRWKVRIAKVKDGYILFTKPR